MLQTKTTEAQIQKYISSVAYPCSRDELIENARRRGASKSVIQAIRSLPYDYFMTPREVWDAIK